jgi:hypothetical protein
VTGAEKSNKLIELLESGKTLYITTPLRTTVISPKTYKKWKDKGLTLFKGDKSLYMANGSKFVCIDYCKITSTK